MKNFLILIVVLLLGKWYFSDASITAPSSDVSLSYIVKYSGEVNKNDYLPMLVALHGNGDTASEVVELLSQEYLTSGKPILLGFSGGGMMAYYQAVKYGHIYSHIFPISGQMSQKILGDESSSIEAEVHAYHGRNDGVVSFGGGQNGVKILQEKGAKATMTPFKGNHHGIFTNMKTTITRAVEEKLQSL